MFGWTQTGSIRGTGSPAEAVWRHAGGKVAEICTMQDQVTTPKQVVLSQQRSVRSTPVLAAGRPGCRGGPHLRGRRRRLGPDLARLVAMSTRQVGCDQRAAIALSMDSPSFRRSWANPEGEFGAAKRQADARASRLTPYCAARHAQLLTRLVPAPLRQAGRAMRTLARARTRFDHDGNDANDFTR